MNSKLRNYINAAFANAPKTKQAVELKEEILQNIIDKYNDLIAEGKSEEAAYNIAIASIGDLSELIGSIEEKTVYPFTKEEIMQSKKRSAILISVSVMLYILCVVPCIIFQDDSIGPCIMFTMIAIATGILIYNNKTKIPYVKIDDTMVEDFKDFQNKKREKNSIEGAISGILWAITLALYFLVSFTTGAWYITWLMFVIAGALQNVLNACFELIKK